MPDQIDGIAAIVKLLSGNPEERALQLAEIHRQTTLQCLERYRRPECPERPYALLKLGTDGELRDKLRAALRATRPSMDQRDMLRAYARWVGGEVDHSMKSLGGVYGAEDQGCSNILHLLRVASHLERAGDEDEAYRLLTWIEQEYGFRVPGVIHDDGERRLVAERASLRLDILPYSLRRTSKQSKREPMAPTERTQIDFERVFGEEIEK